MMIAGIVEYEDHASPGPFSAQQLLEKDQESCGVEDRAHPAYELTSDQADGAETGHGLSGRRMLQDGVLDLRRYPQATARTVLLEVTFIQTPQFDVGTPRQTTEFFLPPQLSADLLARLGGVACGAESPVAERVAGTVVLQGPPRICGANVPTRPDRPRAWRPNRSLAASCADHPAADANPSHPGSAVVPLARPPAERPVHPARSG